MIRRTDNYELSQRHLADPPFSPCSCVTWCISSGLPEGSATWPIYTGEDLPLLATQSVLAFHQTPAQSVVEFSTIDPADAKRGRLRRDNELQLLEDTRAYLHCLAEGITPAAHLGGAWDRFFQVYTPRIHQAAQNSGLLETDSEDCVQDVWLVILDVLRQVDHNPQWNRFSCWMHGLIRNQVVNFSRRMARRPDRGARALEDVVLGRDLDPVAICERNERRRLIRHVLTDLKQQVSATNYRLVHLRWIDDREVKEVAAQLDLTSEQVRYRHHRVKKRLRRLLELHGEPSE